MGRITVFEGIMSVVSDSSLENGLTNFTNCTETSLCDAFSIFDHGSSIDDELSLNDERLASLESLLSDQLNSNRRVMLSPPSSSDGDAEWENLFPELATLDDGKTFQQDTGSPGLDKECTLVDQKPVSTKNILQTIHSYAAPPTRLGRPPKYAELEPNEGFAISGHMSKNAVLARENRRKKKEYVTSLEQQIRELDADKTTLQSKLTNAECQVTDLQQEVEYLKSVIANETTIGSLLKHIPSAVDISMKKRSKISARGTKRSRIDHDYITVQDGTTPKPGVCLHVAEGIVSLEFCKKCNNDSLATES